MKSKYRGIFYIVLSAFFFAWMNAFVRLSGDIPTLQKLFFRNLIAMIVALVMILREKGSLLPVHKNNLKWFILRSVAGTVGMAGNFYAQDHLALADASMLNKMSPFFAILTSFFLLREKLKPVQGLIVIGAFIGSLFIIKPSFANILLFPAFMGLIGGFGAGLAYSTVRLLGVKGEKGTYVVFFFSAFSCLCTLPYVLYVHAPMSFQQVLCLFGCGISAALGQFSITAAYIHAPAREISVYDYSQLIFATVIGFILFQQVPDGFSFIGYFIIVAMAIAMFFYNNRPVSKVK